MQSREKLRSSLLAAALLLTAIVPIASAQETTPATPALGLCYSSTSAGTTIAVNLDEMKGPLFLLMVSFDQFKSMPMLIGPYPLPPDGNIQISSTLPPDQVLPKTLTISMKALYLDEGKINSTQTALIVFNDDGCTKLDADFGVGGVPLVAGELASEQWAGIGLHVSCESQLANQPDKCIIFDSANPTGNDFDLATPGYGPGNTVAYGKLFIIAENDVDANNDGLVDDPDDAFNGGVIHFDFDQPQTICSCTLIDLDDSEPDTGVTKLRFFEDNAGTMQISAITAPAAGDNSAQTLFFRVENVRRFDVKLGGSGGVPEFGFCPTCIDFDQTTAGIPLNLQVGEEMTEQFASQGIHISAKNQDGTHPNKAIIFDTANPTGGDLDLMTPGTGVGNDTAEGKVIIIAENDVDANNDGLVDDPDDEATGGNIFVDFDYNVKSVRVTVLDVDDAGTGFIEGINALNVPAGQTLFTNLGNNSKQTAELTDVLGIRRLKIHLGGSGAVTEICFCPDP